MPKTVLRHARVLGVPYPPGKPQVLAMDGSGVTLGWEQPIASGSGGPVAGYNVEYRTTGAPTWLIANDYLIQDCEYSGIKSFEKCG